MEKTSNRENPSVEDVLKINSWAPTKEERLALVTQCKSNILDVSISDGGQTLLSAYFDIVVSIGRNEALLYSYLFNVYSYFLQTDQLNEYGEFYCSIDTVKGKTSLTRYEQKKALEKLEELNLLVYRNAPLPGQVKVVRYFTINLDFSVLDKIIVDYYNSENRIKKSYRNIISKSNCNVISVDFAKSAAT